MAYKAQIKKALNKKNLKHKYVSKSIKKKNYCIIDPFWW